MSPVCVSPCVCRSFSLKIPLVLTLPPYTHTHTLYTCINIHTNTCRAWFDASRGPAHMRIRGGVLEQLSGSLRAPTVTPSVASASTSAGVKVTVDSLAALHLATVTPAHAQAATVQWDAPPQALRAFLCLLASPLLVRALAIHIYVYIYVHKRRYYTLFSILTFSLSLSLSLLGRGTCTARKHGSILTHRSLRVKRVG